jgi:putative hydrolase of the HAD superfamily
MSISTVIFDYGCVLSLVPKPEDYEPVRKALGAELSAFQELYWRNREAYDLDALDMPTYWQQLGHAMGATFSPEQIQQIALLDCELWGRINPVMMEWVRVLRARGLKTAILSNISRYVGGHYRQTAPWVELFDHLCFSGELRIGKPGAAIYQSCLKALGVPAAQTLFLDDREVNVTAARALGMNALVFYTPEQLAPELEPYGLAASLAEAKNRADHNS